MFSTCHYLKAFIAISWTTNCFIAAGVSALTCTDVKFLCKDQVGCSMAWHNYHIHCWNAVNGDRQTCSLTCKRSITTLLSSENGIGRLLMNCSSNFPGERENQRRLNFCSRFIPGLPGIPVEDNLGVISCSSARIMCETDARCHTDFQVYISHCRPDDRGLNCTRECKYSLHRMFKNSRAMNLDNCTCDTDPEYLDCETIHANINKCNFENEAYKVHHTNAGSTYRFHRYHVTYFANLYALIIMLKRN